MAKISNKQYAEALYEISNELQGKELNNASEMFAKILVRDHKLKQGANIIAEFQSIAKKEAGIVELQITSARELDKKIIEQIKKVFSTQGGGSDVEATTNVDKNLIGGVKIKLEDKILDASVTTQLKLLKQQLVN